MRRRSNCFVFALLFWIRRGGYLAVRLSRPPLDLGLHWVWISEDRRRILHYAPADRAEHWYTAIFHKLWYTGKIKREDARHD